LGDYCLHLFYSGRVQGVGFRYTVLAVCGPLGVSGWVRNLADGRVEAWCEGERDSVQTALTEVRDRQGSNIREIQVTTPLAQGFDRFEIRR